MEMKILEGAVNHIQLHKHNYIGTYMMEKYYVNVFIFIYRDFFGAFDIYIYLYVDINLYAPPHRI